MLIGSAIQRIEARWRGIQVTDEMVAERMRAIRVQYYDDNEETYRREIARLKLSLDDVRAAVRAELISQMLEQFVLREAGVEAQAAHVTHEWFANIVDDYCASGMVAYRGDQRPIPDPCN